MNFSNPVKRICCIGAGYVGGPTMAVIADHCPHIEITVVDLNQARIDAWNHKDLNQLPIYEPGLDAVIRRCRGRNLHFSTAVASAVANADMVFLSVNTPTKNRGIGAGQASDLRWIEASARLVAESARGHTIVVEKSTIPVRTAEVIKTILMAAEGEQPLATGEKKSFSVLSNPEFLAEGTAIQDLESPDRVLIGGDDPEAIQALMSIYSYWVAEERIICTNLWSSELSKLTANAFLAQRISSINSIAALCEATEADVSEVARAIGSDRRIGSKFLQAGPGFGGSCFQKDILSLVYLCNHYGLAKVAEYWQAVVDLNAWHQHRISRMVVQQLFGTVAAKRIAVLGFAFKADTNDTRETPAIRICADLLEEGAQLAIYDPKVTAEQISHDLGQHASKDMLAQTTTAEGVWDAAIDPIAAVDGADAVLVLTEWQQFAQLDWQWLAAQMRRPAWLFDTRAICDASAARAAGLKVWRVGEG